MMKKSQFRMLAAIGKKSLMGIALCGLMLTSCTDNNDNPSNSDNPSVDPSQEAYTHQDLMDLTVNPGDSFYNYALGTWLKNHDKDDKGLQENNGDEWSQAVQSAFLTSTDPTIQKLRAIIAKNNDETYKSMYQLVETQAIMNIYPELTELYGKVAKAGDKESVATQQDVVNLMAGLIKKGYSPLLSVMVNSTRGRFIKGLTTGSINDEVKESLEGNKRDEALKYVKAIVWRMLDGVKGEGQEVSDDELTAAAEAMLQIDEVVFQAANASESEELRRNLRLFKNPVKPSQFFARTRAAGGGTLQELLNITDDNSVVDPNASPVFALLGTEDPDNLVVYMMYNLIGENIGLTTRSYWNTESDSSEAGTSEARKTRADDEEEGEESIDGRYSAEDLLESVYTRLTQQVPELISRADYDFVLANINNFDIEGCRTMMEDMRELMDERISNLDWMSTATKTAARAKLAAMDFNIGLPASKPGDNLKLEFADNAESVVSAIQQLRQQHFENQIRFVDDNLKAHGNGWEFLLTQKPLSENNAFYSSNLNQLFIMPIYVSKTLFPSDDEPMRYATAMVFAHEMTHGFDTNGAKYDADGTEKNWWAESDKAAFQALADKMVVRYNELFQFGKVHADGRKTLNENIADLGGVRMSYELYKKKLTADGLSAEQINHQLREFFLSYALLWQSDPSMDTLLEQLTDEHSADRNRIDGITRLMDEWYELFNVTGGKNFVKPEDRVLIW